MAIWVTYSGPTLRFCEVCSPKTAWVIFASTTHTSCPLQHILLTPARAWIATETGWIRTDARPDISTFAFCLQAVKNQGFSLPIQSQYSFWSKHFNWVPAKCQQTLNSPWKLSCMLLKAMLIPETSSPVAELTLDGNPAALYRSWLSWLLWHWTSTLWIS